jgi:hypothetical protein
MCIPFFFYIFPSIGNLVLKQKRVSEGFAAISLALSRRKKVGGENVRAIKKIPKNRKKN